MKTNHHKHTQDTHTDTMSRRLPRLLLKALGITALAFALSLLLVKPISFSATSLFAPPEKDDYTIADFYADVADRRPVRTLDDNIVIVDIGMMDRYEIAGLLEIVSLCGPRVVGLDVMFEQEMDGDSVLLQAIEANGSTLVMPVTVRQGADGHYALGERSYFHTPRCDDAGVVNLPGKVEGGTIREFATSFRMSDGTEWPSFVVAVAEKADPEAMRRLRERGNRLEVIDYPSREFTVIPGEQLFDRAEEITGKIVLIGALNDLGDMHSTPVNSYLSGVRIHASALSTILTGNYYNTGSVVTDWLMAWILCYLVTLAGVVVNVKIKGLVVRVIQLVLVYLTVLIGYKLYVDERIIINFSYTLLMVTFGLFATDIWNGVAGLWQTVRERRARRRTLRTVVPESHDGSAPS